jgi:hypothetical protein
MITRVWIAAALASATACDTHQSDQALAAGGSAFELAAFSFTVPPGWNELKDPGVERIAGPNSCVLLREHAATRYKANIFVKDLTATSGIESIQHLTLDQCKALQTTLVQQKSGAAGRVQLASFGAFTGCDYEVNDPRSAQGTRQISVTDGHVLASVVCNRDNAGDADADAACDSIVRSIRGKSH